MPEISWTVAAVSFIRRPAERDDPDWILGRIEYEEDGGAEPSDDA
jgi:hypothetical protein